MNDNYLKKNYDNNLIEIYKDENSGKWIMDVEVSESYGLKVDGSQSDIEDLSDSIKRLELLKRKISSLILHIQSINSEKYSDYKFKSIIELELDTSFTLK
jgi:hypothetical protein